MTIYYLNTEPETIRSLITTGKLPSRLPPWVSNTFFCLTTLEECLSVRKISLERFFIVEIETTLPAEVVNEKAILGVLDTETIKRIVVFSQKAFHLLEQIFQNQCPKPITMQSSLISFPEPTQALATSSSFFSAYEERALEREGKASKRPRLEGLYSPPRKSAIQYPYFDDTVIERLSSSDQHVKWLQKAFHEARDSILITSLSITAESLEYTGLIDLIPLAAAREVRMYFYYNDCKTIEPEVESFLKKHKVFYVDTFTHSKILAVDKRYVVSGSFNWLSANNNFQSTEDGSLCLQGKIVEPIIELFWKYIKHYRSEQYGNIGSVIKFERNPYNMATSVFKLNEKSELHYIPTLEEHCGFLRECFKKAKHRIIICSPFISNAGQYKADIDYPLLLQAVSRNVNIYFICTSETPSFKEFSAYIGGLNVPRIHILSSSQIHLKTIIIDDNAIAESSFNWLSASRSRVSDFHNHEQTLYVEGNSAKPLIQQFFKTKIGELIRCCESVEADEKSPLFYSTWKA